ncbi:MFS general substrate transporter [Apiospora phragmitis]|uniref:MFS general substrate transporter n=1 Tax=Apiospora phragmitis TaxID=2905665 RepID=A0ABR1W5I5_9PEZI
MHPDLPAAAGDEDYAGHHHHTFGDPVAVSQTPHTMMLSSPTYRASACISPISKTTHDLLLNLGNQHIMGIEKSLESAIANEEKLTAEDPTAQDPASGDVQAVTIFDAKLCYKLDLKILTPMFFLNFPVAHGPHQHRCGPDPGTAGRPRHGRHADLSRHRHPCGHAHPIRVPRNLLMRWLDRGLGLPYMRYLSLVTVGLGVVTLGQAFDKSYGALLSTRFLVGIFDSAVMPGCVFILSLYYPSTHLQWRLSMLVVSNIVSNVISNILAFGIAHIRSANGWHGWRWIFLIEGLLTITVVGAACVWSDIGRPEKATFLSERERTIIATTVESRKSTIRVAAEVRVFFSNPLSYLWATMMLFTVTTLSSVAAFAPSFVAVPDDGVVGGPAEPPLRGCTFRLHFGIPQIIGYVILHETDRFSPGLQLLALYVACMGTYTSMAMLWALTCLNAATPFQKAFGSAFVIGVGNTGNFVSAWIFRSSEAPRYTAGMTTGLVLTCVAAGLAVVAWGYIIWYNRSRGAKKIEGAGFENLKNWQGQEACGMSIGCYILLGANS